MREYIVFLLLISTIIPYSICIVTDVRTIVIFEITTFIIIKQSFYRAANVVLGKIETLAPEDVIMQWIKSKCMPVLMYGLEVCPLRVFDKIH